MVKIKENGGKEMRDFNIEVEEILQKVIKVKAENLDEALNKVNAAYKQEVIVLDYNDLKETNYREYKDEPYTEVDLGAFLLGDAEIMNEKIKIKTMRFEGTIYMVFDFKIKGTEVSIMRDLSKIKEWIDEVKYFLMINLELKLII